ncbi:deoxyguanosinetriphosphate triphosphohydrolase [Selenomonadales bacterium OttesenSCG-928-I06]|nr:deoxyguanosinetriphosphate triphosphohydrolase [Selenomonadales bacterium OttesenSCG-928-I06]
MTTIRKKLEDAEVKNLSIFAAKSKDAIRTHHEVPCKFRTFFQRDRDRIIHSKSFRRLKHKTQVYISPTDHYRTRITHSLEVSQIARTIARGLNLNEDLTEAIALGHDVGHTPFGHTGEDTLRELVGHFNHNEQSLRIVEFLDRNGRGLNLTLEVKDGILHHTGDKDPFTLEGNIVKISDRIAYLCHDYDDGLRAHMINLNDIPKKITSVLGSRPSEMITVMVGDIIINSQDSNKIKISKKVENAMNSFRDFMFEKIYFSPILEPNIKKANFIISKLYEYYYKNPGKLPQEFLDREEQWGLQVTVTDYIAGLTDQYAIKLFEELFIPKNWGVPT